MDCLGREHQELTVLEVGIDVTAIIASAKAYYLHDIRDLLAVTIARNDTGDNRLQQSSCLPSCRTSFGVTKEALLRHDWDSIARSARNSSEDIIPDASFVLFL